MGGSLFGLEGARFWSLSAALLLIWCGLLTLRADGAQIVLLCGELAIVLGLVLSLSPRTRWNGAVIMFLSGLAFRTVLIFIIQSLPQSREINPDSITYDLNAQALVNHWRGMKVTSSDYLLQGLIVLGRDWLPDEILPYGTVFGSRHFLYTIYIAIVYWLTGVSQSVVILSQVVLLAALGPIVYDLSHLLFKNERVSAIAAFLTLIDSNFAAVGAVLMKDSLVVFVMILTLWTTVMVIENVRQRYFPMIVLVASLSALSILRYHVLVALWAAMLVVAALPRSSAPRKRLVAVVAMSFVACAFLNQPDWPKYGPGALFQTNLMTIRAGVITLRESAGSGPVDMKAAIEKSKDMAAVSGSGRVTPDKPRQRGELVSVGPAGEVITYNRERIRETAGNTRENRSDFSTATWLQNLRDRPVSTVVKVIAHTLFAPYPWVLISHGLVHKNFIELLYPGTILWIIGLPFLFTGVWQIGWRGKPEIKLLMMLSVAVVGIYVVFYGEFSSRQRIFFMPLFWTFIAFGIDWTCRKVKGMTRADDKRTLARTCA